mmetsp:Transcript_17207/g.31795  ORF Transcript_17207/g.31795 Transcript_17207/m.31795 type:complete len:135 (+) Transcript_17207:1-405(+)
MEMFNKLLAYKEEHNSTLVPAEHEQDPLLGTWVKEQRRKRNMYISKADLYKHRIDLLDSIGFVWDPYETQWQEMFERLVKYKEEFGSTLVPRSYEADPELGLWVGTQRTDYSQQTISEERIGMLESIGFVWKVR